MVTRGGEEQPVDVEELTDVIGLNVRRLRQAHGLSQDTLAAAANLSKGTVVAIEQQRSNPSVATLCALSETLGVGLSSLLEPPSGPMVKHRRAADAVVLWSTPAGSHADLLVGTDPPTGVELWDWVLVAGESFGGGAHPRGTIETIRVHEGRLAVEVAGRTTDVDPGDVCVFEAHEPHRYSAAHGHDTRFSMWIVVGDSGPMPLPSHDPAGDD